MRWFLAKVAVTIRTSQICFFAVLCTTCASAFLQQGQNCENYIEKVIASEYELEEGGDLSRGVKPDSDSLRERKLFE
jgi:hypothetical protein